MFFKQVIAFLSALIISFTCGVTPVVRSTDAKPIPAAEREYRFDRDKLQLGAYCFKKDEHYSELRQWFKDAGLDFTVGLTGLKKTVLASSPRTRMIIVPSAGIVFGGSITAMNRARRNSPISPKALRNCTPRTKTACRL